MIVVGGIPGRTQHCHPDINAILVIIVQHLHCCHGQGQGLKTTMPSGRRTCRGIGRGHPLGRQQKQKGEEESWGRRRRQKQQRPRLCGRMRGLSSTPRRGRFTWPNDGDVKEDRGSSGGTATTGPPTTAGAEKNATTEARFPQWWSIR